MVKIMNIQAPLDFKIVKMIRDFQDGKHDIAFSYDKIDSIKQMMKGFQVLMRSTGTFHQFIGDSLIVEKKIENGCEIALFFMPFGCFFPQGDDSYLVLFQSMDLIKSGWAWLFPIGYGRGNKGQSLTRGRAILDRVLKNICIQFEIKADNVFSEGDIHKISQAQRNGMKCLL